MENKNRHVKKMIAPIIIVALLVIYYIGFVIAVMFIEDIPFVLKMLMGIVPVLISGVAIFVLVERMKEIRSGEEDDLDKY